MLRFALRRALLALAVGLAVSAIAFLLLRVSGDLAAALAGEDAPAAEVERIRAQFGLDRPLVVQYAEWLGRALTGDFGLSLANQRPIAELIGQRAANTFFLAGDAAVIAVPLAVGLGLLAALYRGSFLDRFISSSTLAVISTLVWPNVARQEPSA